MLNYLKREPVRAYLYTVTLAALVIVGIFVPDLPTEAIIGLVTAILAVGPGGAELVRANVTPVAKLNGEAR